jgi:hypothetical protein
MTVTMEITAGFRPLAASSSSTCRVTGWVASDVFEDVLARPVHAGQAAGEAAREKMQSGDARLRAARPRCLTEKAARRSGPSEG